MFLSFHARKATAERCFMWLHNGPSNQRHSLFGRETMWLKMLASLAGHVFFGSCAAFTPNALGANSANTIGVNGGARSQINTWRCKRFRRQCATTSNQRRLHLNITSLTCANNGGKVSSPKKKNHTKYTINKWRVKSPTSRRFSSVQLSPLRKQQSLSVR